MPIDPRAATGFAAGADPYVRARPSYPGDAIDKLVSVLGIVSGSRVVDLGAGTGKLTGLLVPTGARLVAIEPVAEMRAHLARSFPDVAVIAGVGEAIPLATGSMDAAVAAQAFHWFDPERALPEIHRVLRPGGTLGLVWNLRDTSVEWVAKHARIVDAYGDVIRRHESGEWKSAFPAPGFGPLQLAEFANVQQITPDGVVERAASTSYIATLPDDERSHVMERIRTLVATHEQTRGRDLIDFPHRTHVYWCERL